ncbi:hypothetical protein [Rhodococcus artemisiae]|uniref:Uncharacterized protein n=1 Tax=Rhodococcus artemisiae TaxID=714159 RepID=A0ABU7LJU3_9NOCA|nr:hypothetical protein [Rhodococcus artemisiae]MEE2061514.1 hypothetical protein [Rhodococcus artemisiae]
MTEIGATVMNGWQYACRERRRLCLMSVAVLAALFALGFVIGLIRLSGAGTKAFWDTAAQPIATASTGLLAVAAAIVAYRGVLVSQRTSMKNLAKELEAREKLEEQKHRREIIHTAKTEALAVVIELSAKAYSLDDTITASAHPIPNPAPVVYPDRPDEVNIAARSCREVCDRCDKASFALLIVGQKDSSVEVHRFADTIRNWTREAEHSRQARGGYVYRFHDGLRDSAVAALANVSAQELAELDLGFRVHSAMGNE